MGDVTFVSYDTDALVARVLGRLEVNLGRTLSPSDPIRLVALALAYELAVTNAHIDATGKQNLLRHASGAFLDALGEFMDVTRGGAESASCTLRFSLAAAQSTPVLIPVGTRAARSGDALYWATRYATSIPAGATSVDVPADCTVTGAAANGMLPNEISELVDQLAQVVRVANIDTTSGGGDAETDDSLRARIRLAPTAFSVAGTEDGYVYHTRSARADIGSVRVISHAPREVTIYVTLVGGVIPDQSVVDDIAAYVTDPHRRAMSDLVTVTTPIGIYYNVDVTYYIDTADSANAATIQAAVQSAVSGWIADTREQIGRDINPSELIRRIMDAGARRVVVHSPTYRALSLSEIGLASSTAVTCGGFEDA